MKKESENEVKQNTKLSVAKLIAGVADVEELSCVKLDCFARQAPRPMMEGRVAASEAHWRFLRRGTVGLAPPHSSRLDHGYGLSVRFDWTGRAK
jgi:hypothetical protein